MSYKKKEKEFIKNIWSKVPIKKRISYFEKVEEDVDEYEKKIGEVIENIDKYKTIEEFALKKYKHVGVGLEEFILPYKDFRWFYHEHMVEGAKTDKEKQRLIEFFMYKKKYKEE